MDRRLYRSRTDRIIAGVCGGIAEQANMDPTLIRLAAVVLALATGGAAVIAYVIMAIVVPEEPISGYVAPSASLPATAGGEETVMAEKNEEVAASVVPAPEVPPAPEMPPLPQEPVAPPVSPVPAPPVVPAAPAPMAPQAQRPRRRGGVGFGVALVVIGLILLANQFIPDFDVWRYWPLAVIFVGVASVIRGLRS